MNRREVLGCIAGVMAVSGCSGDGGGPTLHKQEPVAEDLIYELTNERRREAGLHELKRSEDLDEVAQYHSDDMAERNYLAHTGPDGESVRDRYMKFDIPCLGGENIIKMDSNDDPEYTARTAIAEWMESPGHRRNILHPRYRFIGIGVEFYSYQAFVTQNFC